MMSRCHGSEIFSSKQTWRVSNMASLSITSLVSFFSGENKSLERGENHYRSDHINSFTYSSGIIRGECAASMKSKAYKVTVSVDECIN